MDPEEMHRAWWTDKCRLCGQRDGLLYPREICWVCEVRTMPPPAGSREEARALEQAHQAVRLENLLDTPTCSASREFVLPQLECWGLDTLPVAAATLPLNDGLGLGRRLASAAAGLQPGNSVLAWAVSWVQVRVRG